MIGALPAGLRNVLVFDLCGTTQPPSGYTATQTPPPELVAAFRKLRSEVILMPVTGQVTQVVDRLAHIIGLRKFWLSGTEFGAKMVNCTNEYNPNLSQEAYDALWAAHVALQEWAAETGAIVDPRNTTWFFSFWWNNPEQYASAMKQDREVRRILNQKVPGWQKHLEWGWGHDGSSWCKPKCVGKWLAHELVGQHYNVVIAAGDTKSDIALMEVAGFGIVCHDEGAEPDASLIEAAKKCPHGYYIAASDEPHGYGFLAGLKKAAELGLIPPLD